ncbi:hypothetical protein BXQ17_09085 [Polaribacter sp. BM10]|uniref:T9SS type A sorting domain-containing protein n=1 Tax=Polaribacter sp. BM10 TaxID=1529069 RepID=UPI00098A5C40|nr:T9SS type A sorting domain-containing protein [Polaribacter sp. BM10]AQS94205.1 hypothetical protein BXQ17_09085 [Polaribacter sp. BM10]
MKKNYFLTILFTLCLASLSFGQTALITGYVDAPCSGAKPRTVEIYVSGTIDFTGWTLAKQTNGAGFEAGSSNLSLIDISSLGVVKDDFVYVTNDAAGLSSEFNITSNFLVSGSINSNGDDAFQLLNNSDTVIDRFGEDKVDGTSTAWEHEDTYAYRKDGETPNAGAFDASNWVFGAQNFLDNKGLCKSDNALSTYVPFGSYKVTASTTPAINTIGTISLLEYFEGNGPSPEKGINVEGTNLTADITVTAPTNFEVSVDATGTYSQSIALVQTSGEVTSTPIYVRLKEGLGVGTFADNITLSSAGAEAVTIAVTGEVKNADPQFTFAESLSKFSYTLEEGPSDVQNFSVEGLFLTDNFIIAAPENFEVSFSQDADFASSLSITPADGKIEDIIYIRLKAGITVPGNYQGDVTLSSAGVTAVTFNAEGVVYGELTNNIIISGVFDGSLTGGIPKGVELYVLEDVADLSLFGLSSVSNGGGSTDGDIEFNFPSIAVTAGTFIYISSSEAGFTDFFGKNADYVTGVVNINGDDSIELYENGKIIDVFGNVNKDGSGETWEYLDGWAYRNSTSSPQGTTFTDTNWSYSGVDGLEGGTNNATATTPFPIGTFQPATAAVSRNSIEGFKTFPNPVTNKEFTVSTNNTSVKQIVIFNVLGKKVYAASFSGVKSTINVSDMNAGVYIVKVTEDGKTATKKLVIR